jgi:NADPH:quinone reductase-like Zn-dependent oxidoreductase
LVKIMAAPINPSDLYYMKGMYEDFDLFKTTYPTSPGWEASGIVVQSGGSLFGWRSLGKRVAFSRKVSNGNELRVGGCFQQYCLATAMTLSILPDTISFDIGCMYLANPMTALGLREKV